MVNQSERLCLHEEVLLVALHDDKGSLQAQSTSGLAMGGAILSELLLLGRLRLEGEGKRATVGIVDGAPTGHAVLDECLHQVGDSKKRRASDWVGRFARLKDLRHRAADELVRLGVLRREEGRFLIVFPVTRYPEADPTFEAEVNRRLGEAIFGDGPVDDARTVTLLAILDGAQMLPLVFSNRDLRARRKRIKAVTSGDASGAAVKSAVEAMQAAVIAACSVAASTAVISS
jgi:hypothetical protein